MADLTSSALQPWPIALSSGFVLAVAGLLVLARIPTVASLGHWSVTSVSLGGPVPIGVGVVAGTTVVLVPVAASAARPRIHLIWVLVTLLPAAASEAVSPGHRLVMIRGRVGVDPGVGLMVTAPTRTQPVEEHRSSTPKSYRGSVVLTEWDDIGGVLAAVFISILGMLFLVVYLEQWLARPSTNEARKPWRRHWTLTGAPILRRSRQAISRMFR